jgi:hypothetical protein
MGSYIALPEQHRLATQHRVRLSDLKGEFFISVDSQQVPGYDRRVEAYCKKYGKFRPKFYGSVLSIAQAFELIANENQSCNKQLRRIRSQLKRFLDLVFR